MRSGEGEGCGVGQWEPLADRIPVDVRRLATQLRRMKDRSGLTVPALAARTAQPPENWERAFAGRHLPPLDAVEVLAQASGADYDRVGALWKLAEKAAAGGGDRGRGRPLPTPDPLDPLGPEEGLPHRSRRVLMLSTVGLLAVAALVAVLLTAGPSNGRVPPDTAGPSVTGGTLPERGADPSGTGSGAGDGSSAGTGGAATTAGPSGGTPRGDQPSPAMGSLSPTSAPPASPGTGGSSAVPPPPAPGTGTGGGSGGGTSTAPPTSGGGPSSAPSSPGSPSAPTPAPSSSRVCLGLIVLGVCLG